MLSEDSEGWTFASSPLIDLGTDLSNLEIPPSVGFEFRGDLNSFLFLERVGVSELYLEFDLVLDLVLYLDLE